MLDKKNTMINIEMNDKILDISVDGMKCAMYPEGI